MARAIRRLLGEGLPVSAAVRHHIDSTLLNPTVAELASVLADPDHSERDPLLELVCFPDELFQAALEPTLEAMAPGGPAINAVLADLLAQPLQVGIVYSRAPSVVLQLDMLPALVPGFLARLHLERVIDPLLAAAARRHLPAALLSRVRVRLRNGPPPCGPVSNEFFNRLFAMLLPRVEADLTDLTFLLEVAASDLRQGDTMADALALRQRRLFFALQQSAGVARHRQRTGIEAMLLQGVRPPALDPGAACRQMALIERVCLTLFGHSESIELPLGQEGEMIHLSAGDLEGLRRLLD